MGVVYLIIVSKSTLQRYSKIKYCAIGVGAYIKKRPDKIHITKSLKLQTEKQCLFYIVSYLLLKPLILVKSNDV